MRYSELRLKIARKITEKITGSFCWVQSSYAIASINRGATKREGFISAASINLAFVVIMSSAIGLAGCSSTTPKEPEAKELVAASSKATDAPEQELLNEAQRHYASGLYSVARESFERLRDSYPSGSYREFAEIKIADCYFESGSYDDASRKYEEFYRNYPASTSVTYAIFKAARSHQLAFRGVGRDPSPLEKSLEIYNNLLNNYPETSLTAAAKGYRAEVQELLAEGEKNVSDFYSSAGKEDAAEVRMRQFERKQREVAKLKPKSAALVVNREDQDNTEPEATPATEDEVVRKKVASPQLVSANPVSAQAAEKGVAKGDNVNDANPELSTPPSSSDRGGVKVKKEPASAAETEADLAPASLRITNLDCKESGERSVVFFLSRAIPNAEEINQSFSSKKKLLEIELPVEEAVPAIRSCFGERDLAISESGKVSIRGPSGADLMALNHPPRLVLVLRYPPSRPKFAR